MTQVEEGDYEGLVKVMEFLRMVKERQATADVMFEPLRGIINMLRYVSLFSNSIFMSIYIQGDHSPCAKPPVDFKTKAPL